VAKKTTNELKAEKERPGKKERPKKERRVEDRRVNEAPVAVDRRKVQRRRQIDPTTCERDYTNDEIEFMDAMDAYKRANGRMFPTCSEILEVVRGLGYVRPEKSASENDAPTAEEPVGVTATGDEDSIVDFSIDDELSLDD